MRGVLLTGSLVEKRKHSGTFDRDLTVTGVSSLSQTATGRSKLFVASKMYGLWEPTQTL